MSWSDKIATVCVKLDSLDDSLVQKFNYWVRYRFALYLRREFDLLVVLFRSLATNFQAFILNSDTDVQRLNCILWLLIWLVTVCFFQIKSEKLIFKIMMLWCDDLLQRVSYPFDAAIQWLLSNFWSFRYYQLTLTEAFCHYAKLLTNLSKWLPSQSYFIKVV